MLDYENSKMAHTLAGNTGQTQISFLQFSVTHTTTLFLKGAVLWQSNGPQTCQSE